jgi:hypothetical protein
MWIRRALVYHQYVSVNRKGKPVADRMEAF